MFEITKLRPLAYFISENAANGVATGKTLVYSRKRQGVKTKHKYEMG